MIKAHSLLYAVYICLIVSILCGAVLYFATLYNQLNLFYNQRENLYIQNQSYVNFALENLDPEANTYQSKISGESSTYRNKPFGILNLLHVDTWGARDTITSVHLTGNFSKDKTCLLIAGQDNPFYYSGDVKLIGEKKLPTLRIEQKYIDGRINKLTAPGDIQLAKPQLPEVNPAIVLFFNRAPKAMVTMNEIEEQSGPVLFNSFTNETVEVQLTQTVLANTTIKGNFILNAKDSLYIRKSAVLEDIVISSPKIIIEDGFVGSVQLFATDKIEVGRQVVLSYPSVACLYNLSDKKSTVLVKENSKVYGAVILLNIGGIKPGDDTIILERDALLVGDLYCEGKLMVEGAVYGSAYTNKVFHQSQTANYDHCMVDAEIDVTKRPAHFVSIPIFNSASNIYNGVFKKVL